MPVQFLSALERERFNLFPANLKVNEIIDQFTLTEFDLTQIPDTTAPINQLGFALQLGVIRARLPPSAK